MKLIRPSTEAESENFRQRNPRLFEIPYGTPDCLEPLPTLRVWLRRFGVAGVAAEAKEDVRYWLGARVRY